MTKMIFVNLPVKDLPAATRFYEAIGCEKNEQFSDHQASSMVWSDAITFQLLASEYFATFTPKGIADAHATSEVLLAVSRDSRAEVDAVAEAAAAAGGKADPRADGPGLAVQPCLRGSRWPCIRSGLDGSGGGPARGGRLVPSGDGRSAMTAAASRRARAPETGTSLLDIPSGFPGRAG